jgi:hypothetical protein
MGGKLEGDEFLGLKWGKCLNQVMNWEEGE